MIDHRWWYLLAFLFLTLSGVVGCACRAPFGAGACGPHGLIFENLTPDRAPDSKRTAWFTVTSAAWREWFVAAVARRTGLPPERVPFLVTRLFTMTFFGSLALYWARRGAGGADPQEWLRLAFLTIAWFWLLLPTQNPWYWTWALPLLPFARSRIWLLLSRLTLIYYLRFWCQYHASETAMCGTRYAGIDFFGFVMSWLEFAPWLGLLALEAIRHRRRMIAAEAEARECSRLSSALPQRDHRAT